MNKNKRMREIYQKELQDAQGISRKVSSKQYTLSKLYGWKITVLLLTVLFYFLYSPALIFLFLIYAALFFLSFKTEKSINKSYLKKYHIKIPRFDHALALVVVLIAVAGTAAGLTTGTKTGAFGGMNANANAMQRYIKDGDFEGAKNYTNLQNAKQTVEDMFSLLTGERNAFSGTTSFGAGGGPPSGFKRPEGGMRGEGPPEGFDRENFTPPEDFDFTAFRDGNLNFRRFNMRASDLPVYYLFSSVISTVASVIIFTVPVAAILSMIYVSRRKKFISEQNNELISPKSVIDFSDEALDRLLDYGEDKIITIDATDTDDTTE